jgi:hypothetical protein
VRDAVVALHRAGFRVRVVDAGAGPRAADSGRALGRPVGRTLPAAGAAAAIGSLVTLYRAP